MIDSGCFSKKIRDAVSGVLKIAGLSCGLILPLINAPLYAQLPVEPEFEHEEMMNALTSEGPNRAPTMHVQLTANAPLGSGKEFSIPVKIAEADCKHSTCEINSRLDQNTEIIDGEGNVADALELQIYRTYEAISIRFDDGGSGLVEQIILMPKRGKKSQ